MRPIVRASGSICYLLLFLISRLGLSRLKYLYLVISVIVNCLPANTKIRKSTSLWMARVLGGLLLSESRERMKNVTREKEKCLFLFLFHDSVIDSLCLRVCVCLCVCLRVCVRVHGLLLRESRERMKNVTRKNEKCHERE